jgi:maltose O-acetyltransferase
MLPLRKLIRFWLRGYPDPRRLVRDGLLLGEGVYLAHGVVIDAGHCWLIEIGDYSVLAPYVHVLAHDSSTKRHIGYTRIGEVVIGSGVFVGAHSIVLPDVRIGDGAVIAPGSVVSMDIPAGTMAGGNPLRLLGSAAEFMAGQRELLERSRRFGPEYRYEHGVDRKRKAELREAVRGRAAFID